jgi:hypothetical protein
VTNCWPPASSSAASLPAHATSEPSLSALGQFVRYAPDHYQVLVPACLVVTDRYVPTSLVHPARPARRRRRWDRAGRAGR